MDRNLKRISVDIKSINSALKDLSGRFLSNLLDQAYGITDSDLTPGTQLTTIPLQANMNGTVELNQKVILTFPDGSHPILIQNLYGDQPATGYEDDFIVRLGGVGPTISPLTTYPKGSILLPANYSTISGGATPPAGSNTEVQFNNNGSFGALSTFTYDIHTTKLSTPNIEVSGVIDGDIYASDGTSKVLENGTDGTDATFTGGVTGDLTGTADIADKVKVAASSSSSSHFLTFVSSQADADASLKTRGTLTYQPTTGKLSTTRVDATKFVGDVYASNSSSKVLDNGTDGSNATIVADVNNVQGTTILDISAGQLNAAVVGNVTGDVTGNVSGSSGSCTGNSATATKIASITNANIVQLTGTQTLTNKTLTDCEANTQAVGDNSTKLATTAFVLANAGTGGGTPASPNSSVQFNNSGSFGGSSDFTFAPSGYMGGPVLILKARLHVEGESKFGDALNVSSGQNSMATGTTTTASSKDAFSCGEDTVASNRQSFAGGFETTASGPASVSWGAITTASGERAFVIGERNTASGINSFVGGGHSLANSPNSFAFGEYAEATALAAFAIGLHTDASGLCSISGGQYSQATMPFAVSIGNHSSSTGECATSFGLHTTASGLGSFAGGNNATASGNYSFCFGDVSTATSNNALSIGYLTHATGSYSAAFGFNNQSTGQGAVTIGQQNFARGQHGFVGGFINDSKSNNSIVYGNHNNDSPTNNASCQFLFGKHLNTPRDGSGNAPESQFIVGRHNVYANTQHHLFAVGNGPGIGAEANALTVDVLGRVGIGAPATSYQLQLSTDSAAKPSTSTWQITSDERIKTNIEDYTKGLDEIIQIDPKTFDYNGKAGFDESIKGNIGVIAQEIKDVFPETVSTYKAKLNEEDEEETELYNFNSHALTFALINSVKELNAEVQSLRKEVNELKNK